MSEVVISLEKPTSSARALNWRRPLIRAALFFQNSEILHEIELIQSIERSPPETIRAIQQERLAQLLYHAWSQTDYYHEVLEHCGAVRNGNVNLDRFEDIPFLTKDISALSQKGSEPEHFPAVARRI